MQQSRRLSALVRSRVRWQAGVSGLNAEAVRGSCGATRQSLAYVSCRDAAQLGAALPGAHTASSV